jgi:hypothetical protein
MRIGQGVLALMCLLLGLVPTLFIDLLNAVPQQVLGHGLAQASAHGWLWLTPISAETASYGAPLVAVTLVIALVSGLWLLGRGIRRVRRCAAWDCGFAPPTPSMQYTAAAFAQPIRRVFGLLFHIDEKIEAQQDGRQRHYLLVSDRIWDLLYLPVVSLVEQASRQVVRLQSGNIRTYLGWTLVTLLVLLWLTA